MEETVRGCALGFHATHDAEGDGVTNRYGGPEKGDRCRSSRCMQEGFSVLPHEHTRIGLLSDIASRYSSR